MFQSGASTLTAGPATAISGADQAWQSITRADISVVDADGCVALLDEARRVRSWVAAFEARVTSRINQLNETAPVTPVSDVHTRVGGCTTAEGRRKDRRGRTIDAAPGFGEALSQGTIAEGHLDALGDTAAKIDDTVRAELFDMADDLLNAAGTMPSTEFGRHVRDIARQLETDAGIDRNTQQRRDTFFSWKLNVATGMTDGRFSLHPELANRVTNALRRQVNSMIAEGERAGDPECSERTVNRHRIAAEALGQLLTAATSQPAPSHEPSRTRNSGNADITVIIDAQTLLSGTLSDGSICETGDGSPLPPESVRRLVCSGRITPIYLDQTGKLQLGRTQHPANRHQKRALRAKYRTCAFHGCDVEFDRCELHHVVYWEHGGLTNIGNLIPLCSRHHHVVHDLGWSLQLARDRTLTIRKPDGTIWATTKPNMPTPNDRHKSHSKAPPDASALSAAS